MLIKYQNTFPKIHPSVYIADGAKIIGDVEIDENSSVWFNTVIRGDVNYIRIGKETNIQDNCVLHVRYQKYPLIVGNSVTVGHSAVLHACTISDFCLIGIGAKILDNAKIGSYSLIAAGSVVKEHQIIPEGVLAVGIPAKIIRQLNDEEKKMIEQSAKNYIKYVSNYNEK